MVNFKTRVLELALKQINEHTDITATYEQHKKGRVIAGFSFVFKAKKTEKPQKKQVNNKRVQVAQWGTSENSAFKALSAKCPTLTREYIQNLAKTQMVSIGDVLHRMFLEHSNVESFKLT